MFNTPLQKEHIFQKALKSETPTSPLVSSSWLRKNLEDPDLIILDASTLTVHEQESICFNTVCIAHAQHIDINGEFSDHSSPFPHTFPTPLQFERNCRLMGINTSSIIVVYDNLGIYFSPRVWWMFKAMGHHQVYVLDGGLPEWMSKKYETAQQYKIRTTLGNFTAQFNTSFLKQFNDIQANIHSEENVIIDARTNERFLGHKSEPRAGLKSGNIPKSINIPFESVLTQGKLKSIAELLELFKPINTANKPLIFSCGSGVTACIVLMAAYSCDLGPCSLYDGSWTEYATLTKDQET